MDVSAGAYRQPLVCRQVDIGSQFEVCILPAAKAVQRCNTCELCRICHQKRAFLCAVSTRKAGCCVICPCAGFNGSGYLGGLHVFQVRKAVIDLRVNRPGVFEVPRILGVPICRRVERFRLEIGKRFRLEIDRRAGILSQSF